MKKTITIIVICIVALCAGTAISYVSMEKTDDIVPADFSTLNSDEIVLDMYVASSKTVVYESFAYFGESEYQSETDYFITVTGLDTEEGAQYMAFAVPSSKSFAAESHYKKTIEWEQDETLDTPTGFPIKGIVKPMSEEMNQYFKEYFVDVGWFTQEEVDQNPELFSPYYIDTEAYPDTYMWYSFWGMTLVTLSIVALISTIIVSAAKKNRARYTRENAVANTTNANLDDSTEAPLGFDK